MLTFDETKHEYQWDGEIVPNVTRVLAPLTDYSMVPPATLDLARQRGVAVHRMVELDANGDLDEVALPEWMRPVLAYWREFVAMTDFKILASERRVYHQFGFAGTLDLRATMRGRPGQGIVDIKRSFMGGRVIGLQTAAYAAADDWGIKKKADCIQWRAALRLREDSPPRLQHYEDKNDFNVFLAALTMHNWKRKNQ